MAAVIFEFRNDSSVYNRDAARQMGLEQAGRQLEAEVSAHNPINTAAKLQDAVESIKDIIMEYAGNFNTTGGDWTKRILYGDHTDFANVVRMYHVVRDGPQIKCWTVGKDSADPASRPADPDLILQFRRDNDTGKKMHISLPENFPQYASSTSYLWRAAKDLQALDTDEKDAFYLLSTLTFRRCL